MSWFHRRSSSHPLVALVCLVQRRQGQQRQGQQRQRQRLHHYCRTVRLEDRIIMEFGRQGNRPQPCDNHGGRGYRRGSGSGGGGRWRNLHHHTNTNPEQQQQQQQQQQQPFAERKRGGGGSSSHGRGAAERGRMHRHYYHHRRGGGGGSSGSGSGPARRRGPRPERSDQDDNIEVMGEPSSSSSAEHSIAIAIEGCCHGELDAIYDRLRRHEEEEAAAAATTTTGTGTKIDLLLCCGDFQSLRNHTDCHTLAVPPKYRALGSFHRYYSGERIAPVLTIFIGGNHEASQVLQELPYGGWVAPNIYYLGRAGVVNYRGIRIGGISGIYKAYDYTKGHFEHAPFDHHTIRSVYHVRHDDVYRLQCLAASRRRRCQIMLSHDWPQSIERYGDTTALVRAKPFFRQEIQNNCLGSPPNRELLLALQPQWWFAAHLHVKFHAVVQHDQNHPHEEEASSQTNQEEEEDAATSRPKSHKSSATATLLVPSQTIRTLSPHAETATAAKANSSNAVPLTTPLHHPDETFTATTPAAAATPAVTQFIAQESRDPCAGPDVTEQMTRFLSLDKCLPRRQYLSILHVPVQSASSHEPGENAQESNSPGGPHKLQYDAEWLAVLRKTHHLTSTSSQPEHPSKLPPVEPVTQTDMDWILTRMGASLVIPDNFQRTVPPLEGPSAPVPNPLPPPLARMGNPQTDELLHQLELEHITTIAYSPTQQLPAAVQISRLTEEMADHDENEIDVDDDDDDAIRHDDEMDSNQINIDDGAVKNDTEIDIHDKDRQLDRDKDNDQEDHMNSSSKKARIDDLLH